MSADSLSGLLGWMSIACWVVVYSPQILENYQLQSGEGLSVAFIVVWLIGDVCNVVGAVWAKLLSTMIILGIYYALCDIILLFQVYYYRWKNPATHNALGASYGGSGATGETAPLLPNGPPVVLVQPAPSTIKQVVKYVGLLVVVLAAGAGAWFVNEYFVPHTQPVPKDRETIIELKSQILGWISAASYLGARIPQIRKNAVTKCEGLSPALFLFAISGNTAYALSIVAASVDRAYLIANASWIVGSAGTLALDVVVLGQFAYYRRARAAAAGTLAA